MTIKGSRYLLDDVSDIIERCWQPCRWCGELVSPYSGYHICHPIPGSTAGEYCNVCGFDHVGGRCDGDNRFAATVIVK